MRQEGVAVCPTARTPAIGWKISAFWAHSAAAVLPPILSRRRLLTGCSHALAQLRAALTRFPLRLDSCSDDVREELLC